MRFAPLTTWLFVSTYPSGVTTNPEPLPIARLGPAPRSPPLGPAGAGPCTSIFTTEALTCSATDVTVREYASSSS